MGFEIVRGDQNFTHTHIHTHTHTDTHTPDAHFMSFFFLKRNKTKRLKTYLQSKTEEERLTALALMTVYKDISVDKEKVVH